MALDSLFFVTKGITELEAKCVCEISHKEAMLLEKRSSWGIYLS